MNLTFIIPPVFDNSHKPAERTAGCTRIVYPAPNMYELTVVALLEDAGLKVSYKDFVFHNGTPSDLRKFLTTDNSDIYYIWSVNLAIEDDLQTIAMIRELQPDAFIMLMGPAPTYFTSRFLHDDKTVIARGEPEYTVKEWTLAVANGQDWSQTKGLSFFRDGKVINNPPRPLIKDLDELSFPARHHLSGKSYHNPKLKTGPYTTVLTSRNCPYKCIYCVPSSLTFAREIEFRKENGRKPPISFRSPESIDKELAQLHKEGYKAIGFMDDNFIWNEERTLALCASLKRYGFVWGCQARADAITEPIAKALNESGCKYIDIGVESFNDDILKFIKKGTTSEQICSSIKLLQKHNVPVKLNVLIGSSPLETKDTIKDTLRKAKKLKVDQVMFNIVSPFPATEFHKMAMENGWIENGEYRPTDVQRESILNYPHLSSRDMEKALFRNNLSYFISPSFIFKQIRRFSSWSEFISAAKALKVKLFG